MELQFRWDLLYEEDLNVRIGSVKQTNSLGCFSVLILKKMNFNRLQVLRLGINKILTSCDDRGFTSVAFPALGDGILLGFPISLVARVLLEQLYEFERERASSTDLEVHIVLLPENKEAKEVRTSDLTAFRV